MKKFVLLFLTIFTVVLLNLHVACDGASAIAKSKGLEEGEVQKMEENVDELVKKIYASSLFSPEDARKLVDIKTKLDTVLNTNAKDPMYARLFYDVAYICKQREYVDESIQYFKVVSEKFPETAYAERAANELRKMGIETGQSEEEEEY